MASLDELDLAILGNLQTNTRLTSQQIGNAVGLSPTACQRRIKRLRANGAIRAEVAVLDPESVGRRLTAIVRVVLVRGQADLVDEFKRQMRTVPEVQQCYYVAGEHDFVLIVTATDMADYERLARNIFLNNPFIQRFDTTVVMATVKVGLSVPLS